MKLYAMSNGRSTSLIVAESSRTALSSRSILRSPVVQQPAVQFVAGLPSALGSPSWSTQAAASIWRVVGGESCVDFCSLWDTRASICVPSHAPLLHVWHK